MKIKSVRPLNNGVSEPVARKIWSDTSGFASYGFNLSHSVVYTILSYQSMWLKVNYAAEFFAAAMTVIDKEEKLTPLVIDARKFGLKILPPDINKSSDKIEIAGNDTLYMPFQAIKGISTNVAAKIIQVREGRGGRPFDSREDFEESAKAIVGGKINVAHRERLDRIGAFASVEPEQKPSTHPDRLKDHLELMPGFTVDTVKADRGIPADKMTVLELTKLAGELRSCDGCSLKGTAHPNPRIGKTPKFMVVFDAPNWEEAKQGRLLEGEAAKYLKAALKDAGLSPNDGYYSSLVKAPKPAGKGAMPNDIIIACSGYLQREIELLKPPVIVTMGSNAMRYFAPTLKGPGSEFVGKVIFDPKLDASIVFGLNPAQIQFDPSKAKTLQEVCRQIADLVT